MTLAYLHLCDYAFLTDNGKIGIIGIFDRIYSKQFPTVHSAMAVVGQVSEISKENALTLTIQKGKTKLFSQEFVTQLQHQVNPLRSYNFLINLHNFTFPEPGVYDFVISSGDTVVGERKLVLEKPSEG